MKKIIRLFVMLLVFMATETQVHAWCFKDFCCLDYKNFYGKILAGDNFLQDTRINGNKATYQTGYIIDVSLGYYLCNGLSLEAEYGFRRNGIQNIHFFSQGSSNNGHLQSSSYMVNLFWDLPLSSWKCKFLNLQPFIGGGIGGDVLQMHSTNSRINFHQDWNHFSWQVIAGLAYPIFRNTEMTLEYRFHQGSTKFYNHTLGVGIVYNFGCFFK